MFIGRKRELNTLENLSKSIMELTSEIKLEASFPIF